MRALAAAALFIASIAAHGAPIGYDGARHLLNRVGFGATDAEVRDYASLERTQAVERLLGGARREAFLRPPAFVDAPFEPYYRIRQMSPEERMAAQRRLVEQGLELRAWWLREMLVTPSPLTERMTLFWHNHFATSQQKVRLAQLMYRQNALLRREALGNFGTMLHAIAKDPAMLVYLDNAGSRKQAPNENFAREVMELFTLGEGHYGERDVKEAARAFTGWSLDRETGAIGCVGGGDIQRVAFLDHLLLQAAQAVAAAGRCDNAGPIPREEDGGLATDSAGGAQYEDDLIFQRNGHAQIVARLAGDWRMPGGKNTGKNPASHGQVARVTLPPGRRVRTGSRGSCPSSEPGPRCHPRPDRAPDEDS
jgi:hypothetical protein